MSAISMEEIAILEDRTDKLEKIMGDSASSTATIMKSLEDLNSKIDKMLGRHPKTQALLKRLNELNSYTDPNFIMRYDPSKFIQESYVIDSYSRLQNASQNLKKIEELKDVVNPQNLKNVPELEKRLGPVTLKCLEIHDDSQVVNGEVSEMLSKYNEIINTLSDQFVHWDTLLREAEEYYREE